MKKNWMVDGKKPVATVLAIGLIMAALAGCGAGRSQGTASTAGESGKMEQASSSGLSEEKKGDAGAEKEEKRFRVVATVFPAYDWTRQILGDEAKNCDLTLLLDDGVDLGGRRPIEKDMTKIAECDLFIYVGGESDGWVQDALSAASNPNRKVLNLMDALGDRAKPEKMVEGMEAEEHEHGDHEQEGQSEDSSRHEKEAGKDQYCADGSAEKEDHDHEAEMDEHIWLSLKNAEKLCGAIATELGELDAEHAEQYKQNLSAYTDKLNTLDMEYKAAVDAGSVKTVLFGDRFPFRYLMDDYGLEYFAAFSGCSAETEASFETVTFLARKVDELGLKTVLTIEGAKHGIAETIVQNTASKDQKILTMDSMQGTTAKDVADGSTYLKVMQANLDVLKEALR